MKDQVWTFKINGAISGTDISAGATFKVQPSSILPLESLLTLMRNSKE